MPYIATYTLGNGVVISDYDSIRLNDAFNPWASGSGASAIGFARFSNDYDSVIVHSAYATFDFQIRDTSAATVRAVNNICGYHFMQNGSTTVSAAPFDTLQEIRTRAIQAEKGERVRYRKVVRSTNGNQSSGNVKEGGLRMPKFKLYMPFCGLTESNPYGRVQQTVGGDPYSLTCSTSSVPDFEQQVTMFVTSEPDTNGAQLPIPYTYIDVTIWYDCEFFGTDIVT